MASLEDWRRIDWRFLLPSGAGDSVAYLGPVSDQEIRVLLESGTPVTTDPGSQPGVVVVTEPDGDTVATAAAAVRPGGWVLIRLGPLRSRPWSRLVRTGSHTHWEDRLRRHGLLPTSYWHAPNEGRCSYVVALDDRLAVDAMLRRYGGVRLGLLKSVAARAGLRVGLVGILARHVTIRAQRPDVRRGVPAPDPEESGWPVPTEGGAPSTLLVTPWFEASRHVVELHYDRRTSALVAVTKRPRRPWDVGGISHEAAVLRTVAGRSPQLVDQIPRVLQLEVGPQPSLTETAVQGQPVSPEVVRAHPGAVVDAGMEFVRRLPRTGTTVAEQHWFARLLEAPLQQLAEILPSRSSEIVSRTLGLLQPLRSADLPFVFEHGDLSHPNLLLCGDGRLGAVDWERSEPHGLPGHDLCFFLQYVAESRLATFERPGQRRSFDEAFTGEAAWARPLLHRHLDDLGVDRRLLGPLVLASWARSSAGLVRRLAPAASADADAGNRHVRRETGLVDTIEADRDFALWQHALVRFSELDR